MTYEWITRLSDLVFLLAGALIGAWFYHRGLQQKPPLPEFNAPSFVRRKQPETKPLDVPKVGA